MITGEHVLALFLLVGVPVWDWLETRALKNGTDPRRKIFTYRRIVAIEWIAALAAWGLLRQRVFVTDASASSVFRKIGPAFVSGFVAALLLGVLLQAFLTRRSPKLRANTMKPFKKLAFILPITREERAWFAAVALTAGICEEVLYRGFLIRYLSDFPWHASIAIALAISSIVFGMAHGYQGIIGIVGTAFLGAVLGVVFLITGSLWLPIAIHALIDLRILYLLRADEPLTSD